MNDTLIDDDIFPYDPIHIMEGELPELLCDQIIASGKDHEWEESVIKSPLMDKSIRDSKNKWLDYTKENEWIYKILWKHLDTANYTRGWEFDVRKLESLQLTRYNPNEFYDFHIDGKSSNLDGYPCLDNIAFHNYVRKISSVVLLNDDFEGGEFQFTSYSKGESKIITVDFNKKGTIIFFPSSLEHRVTPVTKGVRYSLVSWFNGPPFR